MAARWIKSSYSGHEGNCVEVTTTLDRLRNSKDPAVPVLEVDVESFVEAVERGSFDR